MALSFSVLTQGQSATNGTGFTTASVSPTALRPILVVISYQSVTTGQNQAPTSISGAGLTFTKIAEVRDSTFNGAGLWRANSGVPASGALTITFPFAQDNCQWAVVEIAGAFSFTQNDPRALGQVLSSSVENNTTLSVSITPVSSQNGLISTNSWASIVSGAVAGTPRASWTELAEQNSDEASFGSAIEVQSRATNDTAASVTWSVASGVGGLLTTIVAEVIGAAPLITQPPSSVPKLVGDTLYLDVLAQASAGDLTYQWQDNSGGSLADMAGVTTQNITVSGLTVAMNGRQYRVRVTDSNGTTTSNTFTLAVSDRADANYFLRDVPSDANPNDVRLYDRPDVVAASGFNGTLAVTLDNVTLSATAQALVKGTLANTLDAITVAATAQTLVKGTLATTLGDTTVSATAQALVKGNLSTTLDDVTLAATGTVGSTPISGNLAVTLADVTLAATAQTLVKGNLSTTLDAVTVAATAQALIKGTLANTLADMTAAATAQALVKGSLATTLGDVTLAATGTNFSDPGGGGGDDGHTRHRMAVITVGRLMNS